jgi:hypothetical protein
VKKYKELTSKQKKLFWVRATVTLANTSARAALDHFTSKRISELERRVGDLEIRLLMMQDANAN